jgi:branched-subunit amino acid ABC-type transport system permease component
MLLKGAVSEAIAFLTVVFILLIRPQGLFGHEA